MSEIAIRPARQEEAAQAAEVLLVSRKAAFPYIPPSAHSDDEFIPWVADILMPNGGVWVATDGDRVVGVMVLEGEEIEQLYILPEFQRCGLGDRLVAKAKQLSPRRLGFYTFQTNTPARRFYEDRGFVAIRFTDGADNEEHQPDVYYEWCAERLTPR
jgi:ribosomal protein S18 acetylase RimI-like enzyme